MAAFGQTLCAHLADGAQVAVVAHFWSLRMLSGVLRGLDPAELLASLDYKPANGSVWALDLELDHSAAPAQGRVPRRVETRGVWHPAGAVLTDFLPDDPQAPRAISP